MKRLLLIIVLICLLSLLVGCTASDPVTDKLYLKGNVYVWDGGAWQLLNGGFGGGVEVDPVFTASDVFGVTAADIAGWTNHPPLTTGTHGVAGTIVGTSDAQSLTNKNLTMNNSVPIFWKDTLGAAVEVFDLWADNNLHILDGESGDIFVWLGSGTNQRMMLWPTGSTAVNTLRDSPTLDFIANYWDATNKNWEAKIIHNMITAGATPKSRLEFSINGIDTLRLENNNGTVKAYSDGVLDMTTHQIINVVDPTLAQDAATKTYVDSMGKTATGFLIAGTTNAIGFAWHNPEAQDILIKKVVVEVTTGGGSIGSYLDVGIADNAVGTNRGTEFLSGLLLLNNMLIYDSYLAIDGGNQTKWILCEDSASATDGWIVGQILVADAASLVGKFYIEYTLR